MIKFWFYAIVMLLLIFIGLTVGFGFVLGVYACLLLCLKLWFKAKLTQVSLNKLKKQQENTSKEVG